MAQQRRRPTSADVAARAGVSRTTVSFVLNGRAGVQIPPATWRRVEEAARALDYHPHGAARQLAGGQSLTLGLVLRQSAAQVAADALLSETVKPFKGAELIWVQEEPFNMGAWYHVRARWPEVVGKGRLVPVARPESASPATGSEKSHKFEQQLLVDQAFGEPASRK